MPNGLKLVAATPKLDRALKNLIAGVEISDTTSRNPAVRNRQQLAPAPQQLQRTPYVYEGPFAISYDDKTKKITIRSGYLNCNAEWKEVGSVDISPENGHICVCSSLSSSGSWGEPKIEICDPKIDAYPIGYCKIENDITTVSCYGIPVAIILSAGDCGD